jgi:hypothetical protein
MPIGQAPTTCIGFEIKFPTTTNTIAVTVRSNDLPIDFVLELWFIS